jgi:hypothetical protein
LYCVQVPRCCWCKAKHWTRRLINYPELSRSQHTSPSDVWFFTTGSINLGFLLRERLATVLIIPFSWGSQLGGYAARIICTYIILESYIALMSQKYFGLYIILGFALPEIVFVLRHCMLPSSRNASLDHCCFLKTSNLLPIHHYGIVSLRHVFAFPLSLNG